MTCKTAQLHDSAQKLRNLSVDFVDSVAALTLSAIDEWEEVEWQLHKAEGRLIERQEQLRKPAAEVAKAATSFVGEVHKSYKRVLRSLR
jgi:hypothetical protein